MGVVINPESELGKELAKWDAPKPYMEYPRMLYRAQLFRGKSLCMAPAVVPFGWKDDAEYARAVAEGDAFTKSCQRIVADESAERIAMGQGWARSPQEALALAEREAQEIGNLAAEANASVRRMSAKAQQDFEEVSALTHEHVPDVGRKTRKQLQEQATEA